MVFPREPLVKVIAPIMQAQLIETALLNIINHQSLIATKTERLSLIHIYALSMPTSYTISTLAPSRVPRVRAPLSMNFMLLVPDASLLAVDICSLTSAAAKISSALETR